MLLERFLDARYDFRLAVFAERLRGDHIGIVGTPVTDADLRIFLNYIFEADRLPRGRVEQRLSFISASPLRTGDVIFSARGGGIAAPARCHQALHKSGC